MARCIQSLFAILLGQADDALTLTKVMQFVFGQEFFDSLGHVWTKLIGLALAPVRGSLVESGLFRWIVVPVGLAAALGNAPVRLNQLVAEIELDDFIRRPGMYLFAHISMGNGVEAAEHVNVAIFVYSAFSPGDYLEGLRGQRQQRRALDLLEEVQGSPMGRAVNALAGNRETPFLSGLIHLFEAAEVATGEEAVPDVGNHSFYAWFVFWMIAASRIDQRAVIVSHLLIGAVQLGVVEVRTDYPRLEVVRVMCPF